MLHQAWRPVCSPLFISSFEQVSKPFLSPNFNVAPNNVNDGSVNTLDLSSSEGYWSVRPSVSPRVITPTNWSLFESMIGSPQNLHAAARTLITDELTAIGQEARQSYKNSGANAALNKSEMLSMVPPIFVQEPLEIDGMDHVRADSPAGDQLRNMQLLVGSPSPADPDPYIHVVSDSTRLHDNLYELSAAASNIRHRSLCEKSAQGAQTVADSLEDAVNVFGSNEFKRAAHKRNHTWSGPSATQNMGWPKRRKGIQDMPLAWIEEHPEHYYEVVQAEPWASQDFFTPPELLQFVHVDSETFLENIPESIPTV